MISGLSAGLGVRHLARAAQFILGAPIVYSTTNRFLDLKLPDPIHEWIALQLWGNAWYASIAMFVCASLLFMWDLAMKKGGEDFEARVHEIVKGIGDRLRAGAAVETAVAEACRATDGPSDTFEHAIELSDTMPFEVALREAADQCGSPYMAEVCYLIAEAVESEGDTGGAIRRLGMELERNHQYVTSIVSKITSPLLVLKGIALFAVPAFYAMLRWSFNRYSGGGIQFPYAAKFFFFYGALATSLYDGLIFGEWERLGARLPFALSLTYICLNWI